MDPDSASKTKRTVFVVGFDQDVNEQDLIDAFVTFGDIIDISLPRDPHNPNVHRSFAFIQYTNPLDAADAIENMDLNVLPGPKGRGKVLKCSEARPDTKHAGDSRGVGDRAVWESEDWLQKYGQKSLAQAGGQGVQAALPPGAAREEAKTGASEDQGEKGENDSGDVAMQ